jgi:hypothetical protein
VRERGGGAFVGEWWESNGLYRLSGGRGSGAFRVLTVKSSSTLLRKEATVADGRLLPLML